MKNLTLSFILLWITGLYSIAQTELTQAHIKQFYKTKTYVVMDDNPLSDYNAKVEEAVKKYWTITPFEFISQETFHQKRTDENNSFLILSEVVFYKDPLQARYDFFSLLLGGKYQIVNAMPVLGAVPIGYTEAPQESSMYKLGAVLKFLQAHVKLITEKPELIKNDNPFKYYNDNPRNISDKTLYLIRSEMEPSFNTEAKIKTVYPYKFKFVTREQLESIIDKDEPDAIFLHKVGPEGTKKKARCYKVILGTDSYLYYFDYHMISDKNPDGFLETDFKKLSKYNK
ncbi:MAG: hypothetical protein SNJ71_00560 [Bacteroidales bacterium]